MYQNAEEGPSYYQTNMPAIFQHHFDHKIQGQSIYGD